MDNHGLLDITRNISIAMQDVANERKAARLWNWHATPVAFPESKCPYCKVVIRSPYIWFLKGDRLNYFIGVILPEKGKQAKLTRVIHPHTMGGDVVCLGSHINGAALLATGPNLKDIPLGIAKTALWVNKYWGPHWCIQLDKVIKDYDDGWDTNYAKEIIKP